MRRLARPHRRVLGVVAVVTTLVVAAGAWYATAEIPAGPGGPYRDPTSSRAGIGPERALQSWAAFPVGASPRPLVLLTDPVEHPEFRTTTTGRAARAGYRARTFHLETGLPAAPSRAGGWRVIPARAALQQLGTLASSTATASAGTVSAAITAVTLTTEHRWTDRGLVPVPVWSVNVRGARTPATVLAVAPGDLFLSPVRERSWNSVLVSPDGRTLTYSVIGGRLGDGPCESRFDPLLMETDHAVAVGAYERPGKVRRFRADYGCTLAGYSHTITLQLASPLGNRPVLTWSHGAALAASTKTTVEMYREAFRTDGVQPHPEPRLEPQPHARFHAT